MTLARMKTVTYSSQIVVQLSFSKINSPSSAKSNLSERTIACNTSATLEKQICADYVDFGKCQDRFGQFLGTNNDSNFLDIKVKVFKRESKHAEVRLRQNFTMGEVDFIQFLRQRKQLSTAVENFLTEQNLSLVLQSTLSKDMEEQPKLVHKVADVVDYPNRKICVTLL